jgi:taurine dioxygenase
MKITKTSGALGAEVTGIDVGTERSPDALAELRRAAVDHLVVFLPNQTLDPGSLTALTDALGGQGETPFLRSIDGFPGVVRVVKEASEALNFGGAWHSDWSFQRQPPSFTLLYALDIPPYGGDTLWSNQQLAYETLSPAMRATLDGLDAVHSAGSAYGSQGFLAKTSKGRTMQIDTDDTALHEQVHPLVVTHPESGRKGLFVNPTYTVRLNGWTAEESRPLLDQLYRHSVREAFTCRHRWSVGTLAMWDNRSTQHNALNDYHGHRRELIRTTVCGGIPTRQPLA